MISLVPQSKLENQVTISNIQTDSRLYDSIYSINEAFYQTLLENSNSKSSFRKALELLIPNSLRFLTLSSKSKYIIAIKARTISRYCKKDIVFSKRKYLLRDTHVKFLPELYDNPFSKPLRKQLNNLSQGETSTSMPDWILKNRTLEKMNKFILSQSPIRFNEGFYTTLKILEYIKTFSDESIPNLKNCKHQVQDEKKELEKISEDFSNYKKSIGKITQDSLQYKAIQEYEALLELAFMQLSMYYRSIMYLYGNEITNIMNLVDTMYEDIGDDSIKSHNFDDTYEYQVEFMDVIKDLM